MHEPLRTIPPNVMVDQFKGEKASRRTIGRILFSTDVVPSTRRQTIHYEQYSITDICLELPGVAIQPIDHYS
ncbi:MAG: hypothetical protein MJE68_28360 [Proteobacteria bacterium]|nr:hypothetical protein [Pseudomonadota bacterium]